MDYDLTLTQFINSSRDYLTNDASLIFFNGNYSLESELIVENVYSFSMFAWLASSSKAVITCGHNARFEFRNVSIITVSGLEFVGCFENYVLSVGRFRLENSAFFGNGRAIVNGTTVLNIEESVANLDRVAFISAVETLQSGATPQTLPEDCFAGTIETSNVVIGILLKSSHVRITQSRFVGNRVGLGAVIYDKFGSDIVISNTVFVNNSATQYCNNDCCLPGGIVYVSRQHRSTVRICHSRFEGNIGVAIIIYGDNMYESEVSIIHSEFVDNTVIGPQTLITGIFQSNSLVTLDGVKTTVSLSEFINNRVRIAIVNTRYFTTTENLTNNVFINNSAAFEVFLDSECRPDLSLSLGSSRCIKCSINWRRDLIGIVVAAFVAGIALVIFMLALNMTVAVGTLNGILFYANIASAYAVTYFLPFTTPNFVTVFISWLNLDVGFDVCFFGNGTSGQLYLILHFKSLLQLAFPAYVIFLVIVVIVTSKYSSKFAKIIGKGNPVAVLATMILLSYAKIFNLILASVSLFYWEPAYGSRNVDVTKSELNVVTATKETNDKEFIALSYFLLVVYFSTLLLCVIFTALVFSWQWLLRYQDKAVFKWVRYQKLHHFLEPYHAPYTARFRYWTGLLLLARVLLYLISALNFSLDPRVDLMAVIFVVGGLILLKGVTAKRVYKNWPLDVIETAIYFNLVAFSALTWYNLDFGGNQIAVAYMSVLVIFTLLLGVIVFHVLCYTRLYKCSLVEKTFKWIHSKLLVKKPKKHPANDGPEELDGYQLVRSTAGGQELPSTITYSVVEINQPAQIKKKTLLVDKV